MKDWLKCLLLFSINICGIPEIRFAKIFGNRIKSRGKLIYTFFYIHQLCVDTRYSLKNLPGMIGYKVRGSQGTLCYDYDDDDDISWTSLTCSPSSETHLCFQLPHFDKFTRSDFADNYCNDKYNAHYVTVIIVIICSK